MRILSVAVAGIAVGAIAVALSSLRGDPPDAPREPASRGQGRSAMVGSAATPSPVPPEIDKMARYRTGKIDPRVRDVPAEIQSGVLSDPERYVEPLARHLTRGYSDELLKVKVLHDWVADNIAYDVKSYFKRRPGQADQGSQVPAEGVELVATRPGDDSRYTTLVGFVGAKP